jgi:hypothetical protein
MKKNLLNTSAQSSSQKKTNNLSTSTKPHLSGTKKVVGGSSISSLSEFHTWEKGTDDGSRVSEDLHDSSDDDSVVSNSSKSRTSSGNVLGKKVKNMPVVFDKDTDDENSKDGEEDDVDEMKDKENDVENRTTPKLALKDMLTPEQIAAKENQFKNLLHHVKLALKTSIFNFEAAMGELEISRDLIKQSEMERKAASHPTVVDIRNETLQKKLDELQMSTTNGNEQDEVGKPNLPKSVPSVLENPNSNPSDMSQGDRTADKQYSAAEVRKSVMSDDIAKESTFAKDVQLDSQDSEKSNKKVSSIKAKYQNITNVSKKIPLKFHTSATEELMQSNILALDVKTVPSTKIMTNNVDFSSVRITKSAKEYSFITNLNHITSGPADTASVNTEMSSKVEKDAPHIDPQGQIDVLRGKQSFFAAYKRNSIGFDFRDVEFNPATVVEGSELEDHSENPDEESTEKLEQEKNLSLATEKLINATNAYNLLTTNLRSMSAQSSAGTTPR